MADLIPPAAAGYGRQVTAWHREAVEEGSAFLQGQTGYQKIEQAIGDIMGTASIKDLKHSSLSSVECNLTAKTFFDMAAGLTDVKPFWEYQTSNKRFEKNCEIYGKCAEHGWTEQAMDMSFMHAAMYAIAGGSSYLEMFWDEQIQDFRAESWDPRDILPVRPSTSPSIQDCYAVIARKTRTVNHLRYLARYVFNRPDLAAQIVATKDGSVLQNSLSGTRAGALLGQLGDSPFKQRLFGRGPEREIKRIPSADIYTDYIADSSVNESKDIVRVGAFGDDGKPLNNWSYEVKPGEPLYPRKRMIVLVDGLSEPLYDGPSPWWHGQFPYCKLTLDSVPWSFLGKAPLWDIMGLNKSLNAQLQVYDDWMERVANPDTLFDKSVSNSDVRNFNARRSGKKLRIGNTMGQDIGKLVNVLYPDNLPTDFWKGVEFKETKIRELSGAQDMSQMMQLGQMPSDDTISRIQESMSRVWQMRSRNIEVFMREFASQFAYNISQFLPLSIRMSIMGAAGATQQDFDDDPGSIIPDFVHDDDFHQDGTLKGEAIDRGPMPRYDRAREFLRQFTFHIAPGSLLASSDMERKMLYLQLSRAGLIDHWTLMEELGIPGVGSPPAGANTITDRLVAEQEMGLGMNISPTGRKASGQSAPRMTVKES